VVKPELVVCLGATAAQSLLGKNFSVTRQRGQLMSSEVFPRVMATVHPSSLLRAATDEDRHREMQHFVEDLKAAARLLRKAA